MVSFEKEVLVYHWDFLEKYMDSEKWMQDTLSQNSGENIRIPCIVVAVLRMVLYILGLSTILYFFFYKLVAAGEIIGFILRFLVFVTCVNIFVTVLLVMGVKSKNPAKMEYYLVAVGLNAVLYVFLCHWIFCIAAVVECYIFLCSYSLYNEYVIAAQASIVTVVNTEVNTVISNENELHHHHNTIKHQDQTA